MKPTLILLTLLLTACSTALPTPAAPANPLIWQVQGTASLGWLNPALQACALKQPEVNLVYLQRPAPSLDLNAARIALRWGAPASLTSPAVLLGEDELIFIAHPGNPITQLSVTELLNLLNGKIASWEKLSPTASKEPLKVFTYAAGEDIQQVLEAALPGLQVNRETGWLAPDPASARQAVAESPAAFSYIPKRWLNATVKAVTITDLTPARLRQPLLAITASQPGEAETIFLQCLSEAAR